MAEAIAAPATGDSAKQQLREAFAAEVADAILMLDYLVTTGVTASDGRSFDDNLIAVIKLAQDAVVRGELPDAKPRAEFEKAYRDLAKFLAPVTAVSLRATSTAPAHTSRNLLTLWRPRPEAMIWSRKLWLLTLVVMVLVIAGSYLEFVHGPIKAAATYDATYRLQKWQGLQALLQLLVPFTYGALGACVYLLKSSHYYIYTRQFDPLRVPEYYNRMILGAISGGMMAILVEQIGDGENASATVIISARALGFLAGYNTDLLFSAIERISQALLPKIGLQSVQRAPAPEPTVSIDNVSLRDLLDRYHAATTDDAKRLYEDLIKKLRDRI